ncbi:pyruvate formate-lyase activating enzyme [Salmonella enterica subsp. enterica]|uniref:Pyruvate formate-lyase activating enzyme n=1 Tax=Salmonella enterica I TaxID=59201 RepID=A0A3S4IME5_SALET|nr:pyruvate formate-lyase activating enzyme [Salmonella enterica subsp. enterica]
MSNLTNCITNESVAVTADKKPVIGRIHSFESCGTVDGPGIRFITFFQGCLMRCLYCHNRDTWDTHGGKEITVEDLMKEVVTYRAFYECFWRRRDGIRRRGHFAGRICTRLVSRL